MSLTVAAEDAAPDLHRRKAPAAMRAPYLSRLSDKHPKCVLRVLALTRAWYDTGVRSRASVGSPRSGVRSS